MGVEATSGFRGRMEHYLYSGEKKHVVAGIAIFAAIFGVPWYFMSRDQAAMTLPDWQQNLQGLINSTNAIDWQSFERIVFDGTSEALSSVQNQVHELQESMPPATLAWMAAPQSDAQHGQEPSRFPFPGSGHNNNC